MPEDITNASAAAYGLMVMAAMDFYRVDPKNLTPALPPAITDVGWVLQGHIIGRDHLPLEDGPVRLGGFVCYGYVVRLGNQFVAAIRGTDQLVEWLEDAEFIPNAYAPLVKLPAAPPGCKVEEGFWSIYSTMMLRPPGGTDSPLHEALEALVPADCNAMVVGHSLGSALATYLALELCRGALGDRASGCFLASPQPGNAAFATYFDQTVKNYRVINYALDVVPKVPPGPDYTSLPKCTVLTPGTAAANIQPDIGCNHHVICYAAMLAYDLAAPVVASPPPGEEGSATCVLGREVGKVTLAKLLFGIGL